MRNRILNKFNRLKNEFQFNCCPKTTKFIKSNKNQILMYHGVVSGYPNKFNTRHTDIKSFRNQITFLKKYCNVISLQDYFNANFEVGKPNIAITFDDGYLNNYTLAKPILEELNVPATFFVTGLNQIGENILWADLIDIVLHFEKDPTFEIQNFQFKKNESGVLVECKTKESIFSFIKNESPSFETNMELKKQFSPYLNFMNESLNDDYWKLMSDIQIRESSTSNLIQIGSHGYYHNNLGKIDLQSAKKELEKSKSYIENLTQSPVSSIGYPDGSYSRELIDHANILGFHQQVSTERYLYSEDSEDNRIINRKGIYSCDTWGNQLAY